MRRSSISHAVFSAFFAAGMAFSTSLSAEESGLVKARMDKAVTPKMNVLFIYDSSGSMWGKEQGRTKLELGREVLDKVINGLPADAAMGLIAYGHRQKNSCGDIELMAPIGAKSAAEIKHMVDGLKPRGITPLSDALSKAGDAFKGVQGAKMIVLITDGAEECGGDPCEITRKLAESGLLVRVNVVGFSLSDKERTQLQCIAKAGTGRYFDVINSKTLSKAITDLSEDIKTYTPVPKTKPAVITDAPKAERINLLAASNGGHVAKSDNSNWESTISGVQTSSAWTFQGQEVVFAFNDEKPASFSRLELAIPEAAPQNLHEFELTASNDSADGPFFLIGRFSADYARPTSLIQSFDFSTITARYVKLKVLSNYGYGMKGWGDTQVNQLRLMGNPQ